MLDPGGGIPGTRGYARGGDKYTVEAGVQVHQGMGIPEAGTRGEYTGGGYTRLAPSVYSPSLLIYI